MLEVGHDGLLPFEPEMKVWKRKATFLEKGRSSK